MEENRHKKKIELKTASQEERLLKWKEYFKNLLINSPEVTDKPIKKINNRQLDIKLGQLMEGELDAFLKKK